MQSPQLGAGTEFVSLSQVKSVARHLLPTGSTARSVILAEKETLPLADALAKFEVFDRLLCAELEP